MAGPETLSDEELAPQPRRPRRRDPRASARRRVPPRALAATGRRSPCRCSRRPAGAVTGCTRAATSRASCAAGVDGEVARDPRPRALDALLHRLRRGAAEALLRLLPQGRGRRLGRRSPRCSCRCAGPASASSSVPSRSGRCPHAVDEALPRRRRRARSTRGPGRGVAHYERAPATGSTFWTPPLEQRDRVHRARSRRSCSSRRRPRTPTCSSSCGCSTPTAQEIVFQGTVDPHTPIAPGLAARLAPQAGPRAVAGVPALPPATTDKQPLTPGETYDLDVELWPTCIVIPPGYRHRAERARHATTSTAGAREQ